MVIVIINGDSWHWADDKWPQPHFLRRRMHLLTVRKWALSRLREVRPIALRTFTKVLLGKIRSIYIQTLCQLSPVKCHLDYAISNIHSKTLIKKSCSSKKQLVKIKLTYRKYMSDRKMIYISERLTAAADIWQVTNKNYQLGFAPFDRLHPSYYPSTDGSEMGPVTVERYLRPKVVLQRLSLLVV